MNRPIRRVAIVAMVMFGLLLANGTFTMVVRQDSLNANPLNRRTRDEEFAQDRGPILAAQTQIAQTVPSKDQFQFQRTYPDGALYAPITGYYSYDHARSGLESSMNQELAGTADSQLIRRVVDTVTGQKPTGASVETTINPKAQQAAAKALGNRKGAVVALDPRTGAVLAMVTSPSYDPNRIASHDLSDANKAYQELANDPNKPMANRAAREIYPPGSTFKLVTAAAALENGSRPDTMVASPERLRLPQTNYDLTNDSNCGGANITLDRALQVSCNTAFANVGLDLGADKLRAQAEKFGFGSRPLPELNAVASRYPDNPDLPSTALTAIGQHDVAATPLQMTMVTAAIANNGDLYEPYVVSTVRGANLTPIETRKPRLRGRTMSQDNAKALAQMMQNVVNDGTGSNAQIRGTEVGGKTGTAQSDPKRPPYAWFTSYALDDKGQPAVAVTAFVEDADIQRSDIAGGRVAAPIAKAVMEAVL